jgi:hypothetical protein
MPTGPKGERRPADVIGNLAQSDAASVNVLATKQRYERGEGVDKC